MRQCLDQCGPPPALHSFPTRRSSDLSILNSPPGAIRRDFATNLGRKEERAGHAHQMVGRGKLSHAAPSLAGRGKYLLDRKSTRLNSSHVSISYAVFCLKKKTTSTAS